MITILFALSPLVGFTQPIVMTFGIDVWSRCVGVKSCQFAHTPHFVSGLLNKRVQFVRILKRCRPITSFRIAMGFILCNGGAYEDGKGKSSNRGDAKPWA
ncbi:hypothetical protein N8612_00490 [Verrucomicrobia bacterium]|nr:hypothetical protein [Verrucomicrobiota bacterium]